jgi:hypothetical protein
MESSLSAQRWPIIERLTMSGFDVVALRTGLGFAQLRVSKGAEVTVVDLVADPVPVVEAPQAVQIDGTEIFVDTPYEILINKLCALLSRAEFRDLVDLEALIGEGRRIFLCNPWMGSERHAGAGTGSGGRRGRDRDREVFIFSGHIGA